VASVKQPAAHQDGSRYKPIKGDGLTVHNLQADLKKQG